MPWKRFAYYYPFVCVCVGGGGGGSTDKWPSFTRSHWRRPVMFSHLPAVTSCCTNSRIPPVCHSAHESSLLFILYDTHVVEHCSICINVVLSTFHFLYVFIYLLSTPDDCLITSQSFSMMIRSSLIQPRYNSGVLRLCWSEIMQKYSSFPIAKQ